MPLKTALVAAVLAIAPTLSFACQGHTTHQAQSCAQGMVWDGDTGACVARTTS
ncbi:hypothetical protein [Poseidonocella sedimentorum]|uniref:Chitin binding Peritrophin-A domain-containing protein n=1 Tax=Poseidonocella sedimentorum TaxID=871652 RepID=A0A1I6EI61_9RHOB|nr:hypothetical protein [Poseidonocella sedimentorum]SFR17444.1 hypothetical protein SAMN04515673_11273 [Poseidonocella sedimentorum]